MTIHNDTIKGYKVFNEDFSCRNYNFKGVGTTHTYEGQPVLCKSGFHFCTDLQDCFKYYTPSKSMIVCEVEATDYTDAKDDCSKRTCKTLKILRQMSLEDIIPHITDSEYAYRWTLRIGNADIMIHRIADNYDAYHWAMNIGNADIMIDHVTNSEYAYWWAMNIGNRDVMIHRITESEYAYYWARHVGNQDVMIQRITDSEYAYRWAYYIGNQDIMTAKFPELKKRLAQSHFICYDYYINQQESY